MRESHKLKVLNFFLLKINKITESIGKPHKPHHLFLMSCGMNLMFSHVSFEKFYTYIYFDIPVQCVCFEFDIVHDDS